MNLKKVEKFTKRIDVLKERIESTKNKIEILNDINYVEFRGKAKTGYERFRILEDSRLNLENSLEVFKVLAIKELNEVLRAHEEELAELIKKGITVDD